jgi:hypothetical protein
MTVKQMLANEMQSEEFNKLKAEGGPIVEKLIAMDYGDMRSLLSYIVLTSIIAKCGNDLSRASDDTFEFCKACAGAAEMTRLLNTPKKGKPN